MKTRADNDISNPWYSDVVDYYGPDARPGDRVSEFENGIAVWRADTWQTEVRAKSEDLDIIGKVRFADEDN